jgi:hypothetical protein
MRLSRSRVILLLAACGVGLLAAVLGLSTEMFTGASPAGSGAASVDEPRRQHAAERGSSGTAPAQRFAQVRPSTGPDPDAVRKIALEYEKGRFNAFFKGKEFLADSMASGKLNIEELKDQLLNTQELESLPADIKYAFAKPPAVTERMALIDTLEGLAKDNSAALDALVEVGSKPIEGTLAVHVKRALAAEKYDIFVSLTRTNWDVARATFLDLHNKALIDLLKPALIGGLVDSGMSRAQAVSTIDSI